MKNNLGIVAFAIVVIAALFFVSSGGKKVPGIPVDVIHNEVSTNAGCLACHGPGKRAQLKPNHPPKEECLICHKQRQ